MRDKNHSFILLLLTLSLYAWIPDEAYSQYSLKTEMAGQQFHVANNTGLGSFAAWILLVVPMCLVKWLRLPQNLLC